MVLLTLAADPTVTPTASAQTQYGIFGGKLYQHLTAMPDTNWLDLTDLTGGLPLLTLLADPTSTPTAGAMAQFGFAPAGGGLYLHLSGAMDTNWMPLTLMVRALPVLRLGADPTTTPTEGALSQCGTFAGELFQHLAGATDLEWLNVSSLLPAYTPKFTDLTEGELSITLTMTDATVLTVVKTAAQIRTAAIAQGVGALSTGFIVFPHADIASLVGKVLNGAVPITVVANVPFRATGGLKQRTSKVLNVYVDFNPEVTSPATLDGVPTTQLPQTAWTFLGADYLQIEFDFHGVSRF